MTLLIVLHLQSELKWKTLATFAINKNEFCEAQTLLKFLQVVPIQIKNEYFQYFYPLATQWYGVNLQKLLMEGGKTTF